jgi:putative transposase
MPHHVTQRGNNRTDVFFSAADRKYYLQTLARYCREYQLSVWAYCLMRNHVHLLVVPRQDYSLAQAIGRTNLIYTQYANRKYRRTGRLWQNRFSSCPVDREPYLWAVCRYIETNPVRAHRVDKPWDYEWSSARHHVLNRPDPLLDRSEWLEQSQQSEYRRFLNERSDPGREAETAAIRQALLTGRPYGSPELIDRLELKLGRILRPQRAGRKPRRRRK